MTPEFEQRFLRARKRIISARFAALNKEQQAAVYKTEGPLLLLAGAGSGKTTVLINRIANLIQFGSASDSEEIPDEITADDVLLLEEYLASGDHALQDAAEQRCALNPPAPWNIIAITFTNKAAGELKDRLAVMLGEAGREVWAMTFHAACCRILRREIDRLGYASSFTIYDTADSERVMKDVLKACSLDEKTFPPRLCLSVISRAKDQMQGPEEFAAAAVGDFRKEVIARCYQEYQERLRAANAVDFDDIILLTVRILQEFEEVRTYYQRKFRYVLVDEYQDTNHLQYLLTSLLAGGYENICVVGDDDQSIYKFRGATIENILDFETQYPGATVIRLEQNYRSTKVILQAANAVIANNEGRKGKTLWTEKAGGSNILLYEAASEYGEADFVAAQILSKVTTCSFRDIAILYRTNAQSNVLERSLSANSIPYRIIGGTRFFDRAEIKDMLAYLTVIHNRTDELRLRRILNNPPRGIGAKTIEQAERLATSQNLGLYEILADAYTYPALQRSAEKLLRFAALIESCAQLLDTMTLPEFYDELLERTGYLRMLEEKGDVESRTRAENVRELRSNIVSYTENVEAPTLGGFLEEIALYTDIEQYDPESDAVVMMTMHSAKGLEFPHVFLVGLEEGLFPGTRAIGEHDEMEEERRLCYVAITRAKESLTISYAHQRMLYGHTSFNRPSRFLAELPPECVTARTRTFGAASATRAAALSGDVPRGFNRGYSRAASPFSGTTTRAEPAQVGIYHPGDMVEHRAFGRGMVLTATKMGADVLLEIAFDNYGTKKMLERSAGAHMTKQ